MGALPEVIQVTRDLLRVRAIPRRELSREIGEQRARELTPLLKRPGSDCHLKPWQGLCLWEALEQRGLYAELPVGQGKTLLFWLLAIVLDAENPVLVVPPSVVADTYALFARYHQIWKSPSPPPRIITYHSLTQEENFRVAEPGCEPIPNLFERLGPDLLMFDECHNLRNQDRSAPIRIGRYVDAEAPMVVCATGTGSRSTIKNYSHQLVWCLRDNAPVPLDPDETDAWAAALDDKLPRFGERPLPGALLTLGEHASTESDLQNARDAFCDRLVHTPGVVIVSEDSCDEPMTIRLCAAPEDPIIDAHFDLFRKTGEMPDGWIVEDVFAVDAHATWLGAGFQYVPVPRPPDEYREAHNAWAKFVRAVIQGREEGLDTPGQVERAYPHHPLLQQWKEVEKRTPKFKSVPAWYSGSVVFAAAAWAREHVGIVWCMHTAVAEALAEVTELPYYAAKGLEVKSRKHIKDDPGTRSVIASFDANYTGRNLQAFNRGLLIGCTTSALEFEQWLGRIHRGEQESPCHWDIMFTSSESRDAFYSVLREANFVHTTKRVEQKVLRADRVSDIHVNTDSKRWAGM